MRRRATVVGLLLALVGLYSATRAIAPEWTRRAGLDFWNHAKNAAAIRAQEARNQDLDQEMHQLLQRDAICDQIALDVCERRISVSDALGDLAALTKYDPRWWASLRFQYQFLGVPLSASDREAVTLLLRRRIELLLMRAEKSGDTARAALVADRLASFDEEVRELGGEGTLLPTKP